MKQLALRFTIIPLLLAFGAVFVPVATHAQSKIRMVHALDGGPAVDVFIDGEQNASVRNLTYRQASNLIDLTSDEHEFSVRVAIIGANILDSTFATYADTAYTVFAAGSISTFAVAPVVLKRSLSLMPSAGNGMLRALHAAPEAGDVSVRLIYANDMTFGPFTFTEASEYFEIPAGDFIVQVIDSEGGIVSSVSWEIDAGDMATLIGTGSPAGGSFAVHMLYDNDEAEQRPMLKLPELSLEIGSLRTVNVSGNAGVVDAFINGNPSTPTVLSFRHAGGVDAYEAGSTVNMKVSLSGQGPDAAFIDEDIAITADVLNTAFVVPTAQGDGSNVLVLQTTPADYPSSGRATFRLLQASPDIGSIDVEFFDMAGATSFNNIPFGESTPYVSIPGGNVTADVYLAGSNTPLFSITGSLPAGGVFTLIATGTVAQGTLGINTLIDIDPSAQQPMLFEKAVLSSDVRVSRNALFNGMKITPNPVRDDASLTYSLVQPGNVRIVLYDETGAPVIIVPEGIRGAGDHIVTVQTDELHSGAYTVVVEGIGTDLYLAKRIVVVK